MTSASPRKLRLVKKQVQTSTQKVQPKKRASKLVRLRVIADAPFKGSVSVKELDAAIASVMAKRKPEVEAAVHLASMAEP